MTRTDRNPSAARIAVTLGAAVAGVMLAIWGASAIAGTMSGELRPEPKLAHSATKLPTRTAQTTTPADEPTIAAAPKPKPAAPAPKPAPAAPAPKPAAKYVVVIDPGHGGELSGTEPIGPWQGAEQKVKTQSGAEGEAQIVLQVGLKLRPLLEKQGVKVIMTRTSPAALSNIDRAKIANNAHADLFVRLHCDGSDTGSSAHGISMQLPSATKGWAPIGSSRKAGEMILSSLIRETGAKNLGLAPRADLTGFNWSKVPTALPEMGFVSNPAENAKLHSASYQQQLAQAIADGTMAYLRTVR